MNCKEFGYLNSAKFQRMHEQSRRIYDISGLSPTIHTMGGGNTEVKVAIQKIDIPQTVKVRKFPVDTERLCKCLRDHKEKSNSSNMVIAQLLNVSQTKVEHWFRQDKCFAIPDAEIWLNLKQILGIETNEFDNAIMTFEEKEGVFEKSERHYFVEGLSPTLTSMSGQEKIIVKDNPLALDEQNKRIRTDGTVGTIMTDGSSPKHNNRVLEPINTMPDGTCRTLKHQYYKTSKANFERTSTFGATGVTDSYRIRKLTPKECWRLMGFDDADFEKAEKVCSNTQLYKQAGNSIVVNVLEGILGALLGGNKGCSF